MVIRENGRQGDFSAPQPQSGQDRENVILRIHTLQGGGPDEDMEMRFVTEGERWTDEAGTHLKYTESEISGLDGTRTEIILHNGTVAVHRDGEFGTDFLFEMGKPSESVYETPFGRLQLQAVPERVEYSLDPEGGRVHLEYHLLMHGEDAGLISLGIDFASEQGSLRNAR